MARGDKEKYTQKQKRKASHIEASYKEKGLSEDEAEKRAWATVNKHSGGGERAGGSGTKKPPEEKRRDRRRSAKRAVATKRGVPRRESENLETKESLLKKARARKIPRRYSMSKKELIAALQKVAS